MFSKLSPSSFFLSLNENKGKEEEELNQERRERKSSRVNDLDFPTSQINCELQCRISIQAHYLTNWSNFGSQSTNLDYVYFERGLTEKVLNCDFCGNGR